MQGSSSQLSKLVLEVILVTTSGAGFMRVTGLSKIWRPWIFFSLARTEENCMLMEPPETWIYQSLDHHPASASIPSIKNDLHISSGACRCQMTLLPWPHRDPTSRLEDLDALLLPPHECLHWRVQWLQKFNRIVSVSIFQQLFRNASMGGVGFGRAADCQFSKPLLNVPQTTPS
jgi:hypothetical protein